MANDPSQAFSAWDAHVRRRIRLVLASIPGQLDRRRWPGLSHRRRPTPDWIRLPIWLDRAWAEERGERLPRGALLEILWGQYALFLCLRIQDDLLDQTRDDLRLLLVADQFLLESLRAFHRLPGLDGAFWELYQRCVRDTVNAALEVGRLEQEPGRFTQRRLGLYARVGSAFRVGVAAVSHLHRRGRDLSWLSRLQDRLTVFGQIADDLEDLTADVKAGRYTWVGNVLLAAAPGEVIPPEARARRLGEGFMRPERGAVVFQQLKRVARAAGADVPGSAPRPIRAMVERLVATPDALCQSMHEARVRWVFRGVLASGA